MSNYNPFASAFSAAAAELSSPAARRFYVNRAQQALQTALILIIQFGCVAFAIGAQCRQWVEDLEQSAQVQPVAAPTALVLALPAAAAPIALLPPAPKFRKGDRVVGFAAFTNQPIRGIVRQVGYEYLSIVGQPTIYLETAQLAEASHRLPSRWVGETVLITPAPKPKRTRKPAAAKSPAKPKPAAKGKGKKAAAIA